VPQPSGPPIGVPRVEVSHKFLRWECYIVDYSKPESFDMASPPYSMRPKTYSNDRLPQSSTGSSLPSEGLWPFDVRNFFLKIFSKIKNVKIKISKFP